MAAKPISTRERFQLHKGPRRSVARVSLPRMKRLSDRWQNVTGDSLRSWAGRGWRPLLRTPTFLIPFGLAAALFLASAFWVSPPAQRAQEIQLPTPGRLLVTVVVSLPSPSPTEPVVFHPSPTATRIPASLPTREPTSASIPPTPSPSPRRLWTPTETPRPGCDPAYPDARTCIPSGPPFAQGCAITDERNFTVLRPDPQRLDADKDGIGCEPIGGP